MLRDFRSGDLELYWNSSSDECPDIREGDVVHKNDCCTLTRIPSDVYAKIHPTPPCEHCPVRELMFANSTAIVLTNDIQAITRYADVLVIEGYPPIERTSLSTVISYTTSRYDESVPLLEDLVSEINHSNISTAKPIKK